MSVNYLATSYTAAVATAVATVADKAVFKGSSAVTAIVAGAVTAGDGESSRAHLGNAEIKVVFREVQPGARDIECRRRHRVVEDGADGVETMALSDP